MDITEYLNDNKLLTVKQTDHTSLIARHLQRKNFRAVVQIGKEGRYLDYSYLTNGYYFAEFHDDGHFYFWLEIANPLIDIKLTGDNYGRIKGLITVYLKR